MSEITLPRLSDSMETGTVLKWLKEDGDLVVSGEDLVEIETDKATLTHTADADGVLTIIVREGETVAVGAPIARLGEPHAAGATPPQPVSSPAAVVAPPARTGLRVSPLARRAALVHGVVLEQVSGTGPRGRITRNDVLAAAGIATQPAAPVIVSQAPAPVAPTTNGSGTLQPLSRLQQVVARRMSEANASIPDFQVQTEVDMGRAVALRGQLKTHAEDGAPPSLNDLIVKAAALALRDHPLANGSYKDGGFELHEQVNVGVAVAADGALVVPTVLDADRKSLGQIARDTRRLAERVRAGDGDPGRAFRRHLHRLESRHVRHDGDHAGGQCATGGDPRRGGHPRRAAARRRRDRRRRAPDADAVVRPPHPVWRRRGTLPRADPRAPRDADQARPVSASPVDLSVAPVVGPDDPRRFTDSGIEVKTLYTSADLPEDLDLGRPGEFPYTRGVHAEMYRKRRWTMRQYAGYASAKESNERYKYLLAARVDRAEHGLRPADAARAGLRRSAQPR